MLYIHWDGNLKQHITEIKKKHKKELKQLKVLLKDFDCINITSTNDEENPLDSFGNFCKLVHIKPNAFYMTRHQKERE